MGALRAFVIAGEPSGDVLGGALMAGLKTLAPGITFDGVGGEAMQAQGLASRFEMSELSVMGLTEVLPKYFHLKARIRQMADLIVETRPDILITIDSPDFCLRVAAQVKAKINIRTVHYVAPSVWAWRPGRAQKMAKMIDHVLALLPFEPPFMQAAGMRCDFVGHPAANLQRASAQAQTAFKERFSLKDGAPLIAVLPGSRLGEIKRMGPVFGAALGQLAQRLPHMRVVLPAASGVADAVCEEIKDWPIKPVLLDPRGLDPEAVVAQKFEAFSAADLALITSGTVALELAAAGTPMVSAYDFHPISRILLKYMVKTDTGSLINLVSNTRIVPEFIGDKMRANDIAQALYKLSEHPDKQQQILDDVLDALGRGGELGGLRAARAVLDGLGSRPINFRDFDASAGRLMGREPKS